MSRPMDLHKMYRLVAGTDPCVGKQIRRSFSSKVFPAAYQNCIESFATKTQFLSKLKNESCFADENTVSPGKCYFVDIKHY
jgi:hypothetical protein